MKHLTFLFLTLISIFAYSQPAPTALGTMLCRFYDKGKPVTVSDSLLKFGIWSAQAIPYSADTVVGGAKLMIQKYDTMNIEVNSFYEEIWVLNKIIRWDSVPYNSGNISSAVSSYMIVPYKKDDSLYVDSMFYQPGFFNLVPMGNTPMLKREGKRYIQCVLVKHVESDSLIADYAFNNAKRSGDYNYKDKAWKLAKYYYQLALEYSPNDIELKARVKELDKLIKENK